MDSLSSAVDDEATRIDGTKILEHIFGPQTGKITKEVAKDSGVSQSAAGSILATLAPIVLGQLGKSKQTDGLDVGGLVNILLGQKAGKGDGGLGDVVSGMFSKKNAGILALVLGIFKLFVGRKR